MTHFCRILFFVLAITIANESMALVCVRADGATTIEESITSPIYVNPSDPSGKLLWRSDVLGYFTVKCWQTKIAPPNNVWVFMGGWFNNNAFDIGPHLQPGAWLNNSQYNLCSNAQVLGGCGFNTLRSLPKCDKATGCPEDAVTFDYMITPSIHIKQPVNSGQEGSILNPAPSRYAIAQFRGETNTDSYEPTLTFYLSGLENIQYERCPSTVEIEPRNRIINFAKARASTAQAGSTIEDRPLTIVATKSCNTPYGLEGVFEPVSGNLSADQRTLIPTNNDSVGIQILDKSTNKTLPFKQSFSVAPTTNTNLIHRKNLVARLLWMKNTAKVGEFSATAKLSVYYK